MVIEKRGLIIRKDSFKILSADKGRIMNETTQEIEATLKEWDLHLNLADKWLSFPRVLLLPITMFAFFFWWLPKSKEYSRKVDDLLIKRLEELLK